jgi:putative transposase
MLKVGSEFIWLWVGIEPENRQILALSVSKDRNMLVAERFLSNIIRDYGKHPVSTDRGTWYPMACQFPKTKTSYSFSCGGKPDRNNNAIYNG